MEPLWSPVVATRGNQRQIDRPPIPQKQAESVAAGCHRLPEKFHGKEGVDGSSPSEGFAKFLLISSFCCCGWRRFYASTSTERPPPAANASAAASNPCC